MHVLSYVFIGIVGLIAGTLSGITGGGGGMLMLPAFILVGLPPQMAVATGKMNGLGAAVGGLSVFSKTGHIRKDILKVMVPIAVVVGVATPIIFSKIDSQLFQIILGIILVLLTPTLFLKKRVAGPRTGRHKTIGYVLYAGVLTIQALFGSGVGTLAIFVLTLLLGTSKLEANATKRAVTAVLTPITFVALLIGGYVSLSYGIVGLATVLTGTHFGSKLALKRGDRFISLVMAGTIVVAGALLIFDAVN